ncbi:hypothetical protein RDWZM_001222 [Blomia tropicalis]|uniref:Uncharacterized protein n=1 Tax=Blomia tropicalis TaxID=40697 RepID=A0A9Q0ME86_BLOTA|nr:hypothetical protein RDWZM_001222 [Blomia tropicalis]
MKAVQEERGPRKKKQHPQLQQHQPNRMKSHCTPQNGNHHIELHKSTNQPMSEQKRINDKCGTSSSISSELNIADRTRVSIDSTPSTTQLDSSVHSRHPMATGTSSNVSPLSYADICNNLTNPLMMEQLYASMTIKSKQANTNNDNSNNNLGTIRDTLFKQTSQLTQSKLEESMLSILPTPIESPIRSTINSHFMLNNNNNNNNSNNLSVSLTPFNHSNMNHQTIRMMKFLIEQNCNGSDRINRTMASSQMGHFEWPRNSMVPFNRMQIYDKRGLISSNVMMVNGERLNEQHSTSTLDEMETITHLPLEQRQRKGQSKTITNLANYLASTSRQNGLSMSKPLYNHSELSNVNNTGHYYYYYNYYRLLMHYIQQQQQQQSNIGSIQKKEWIRNEDKGERME